MARRERRFDPGPCCEDHASVCCTEDVYKRQDVQTGAVLMQAYMNQEALSLTLEKGHMVYWSRSRQELWEKGATSGQIQELISLTADCDGDCLLAQVVQKGGGACHTGAYSCFFNEMTAAKQEVGSANVLYEVDAVIKDRREHPVAVSYTHLYWKRRRKSFTSPATSPY